MFSIFSNQLLCPFTRWVFSVYGKNIHIKNLPETNSLAYFVPLSVDEEKKVCKNGTRSLGMCSSQPISPTKLTRRARTFNWKSNEAVDIRHLWMATITLLGCHRCLILSGFENMKHVQKLIRILTTIMIFNWQSS